MMGHYSAIKKKIAKSCHLQPNVELEDTVLNDVSQAQKDKYHRALKCQSKERQQPGPRILAVRGGKDRSAFFLS